MCITGKELANHIIAHEILGTESVLPDGLTLSGGVLYVYDSVRNKSLTSFRTTHVAGKDGRAKSTYLSVNVGQATSSVGIRIPRNSTVVSVAAQSRGTNSWSTSLRKNNNVVDLYTLNIITNGAHDNTVDLDLDEGDTLQIFCDSPAFLGIREPLVIVEIAGRLT
jgi:hypothetical protein